VVKDKWPWEEEKEEEKEELFNYCKNT